MTDEEANEALMKLWEDISVEKCFDENGNLDRDKLEKMIDGKDEKFFALFGREPQEGENHKITEARESILVGRYAATRNTLDVKDIRMENQLRDLVKIHEKEKNFMKREYIEERLFGNELINCK